MYTSSRPRRKAPAPPVDSPIYRAATLAHTCREYGLDDWQAGYVAGSLDASGADSLPLTAWRQRMNELIGEVATTEDALIAAGLDPNDPHMLSAHIRRHSAVIQ